MEIPKIVTQVGLGLAGGLLVAPLLGVAPAYATTDSTNDDGNSIVATGAYKKAVAPVMAAGAYKKLALVDPTV